MEEKEQEEGYKCWWLDEFKEERKKASDRFIKEYYEWCNSWRDILWESHKRALEEMKKKKPQEEKKESRIVPEHKITQKKKELELKGLV